MRRVSPLLFRAIVCLAAFSVFPLDATASFLDKQKLLDAQSFWDNRDWDWYKENIPFFECPDSDINTTYYYRWELLTKHLTYGSQTSGYNFTEFIDRPFWSGAYGSISCPAGHQLYESRWLRDPTIARDYSRYWFRVEGAQPRRYGCWIADGVWATHLVHPNDPFVKDLLPDLIKNYNGWITRQFVPQIGLFWQNGHDDGMEFNITSRQTDDIVRGANGYRPSFNSYMYADALAIAQIARLANDSNTASAYESRAKALKGNLQELLWDPKREFFFPMFMRDEKDKEGNIVKALTLTYQSGKYAGDPHGREEIGFVPWQFNLPDAGFEPAWKFLMDSNYFLAPFGPTTTEQHDPQFVLQKTCCWWSGQSWPYATTQTLKALANLLQNYQQKIITRDDYFKLLKIYSISHRKNGAPYIAEACNPYTGSWEGHDSYNHSEHYFHSAYNDLIITGLLGIKPAPGDLIEIDPLAPPDWPYFAIDDLPYGGHSIGLVWDKDGSRYHRGAGLALFVDDKEVARSATLKKISAKVPLSQEPEPKPRMNFAVNNDGTWFPRLTASFENPKTPLANLNDGNYWYHIHPPNRWTCEGSTNETDTIEIAFGTPWRIDTLKLYFLEDETNVKPPRGYTIQYASGGAWKDLRIKSRSPEKPTGHRANVVQFDPADVEAVRVSFQHPSNGKTGLTEIETWGDSVAYKPAPPPAGNLAYNPTGSGFPKATASFSDAYGGVPANAIDGKINYKATPVNRWTSYGSTNAQDWLEIDFGAPKSLSRATLCIYNDRGGVQPPADYNIQYWTGAEWRDAERQVKTPATPTGNMENTVAFAKVTTAKIRVIFTNKDKARSGVTEFMLWE